MRTRPPDHLIIGGGGTPPPAAPVLPSLDEGPMRAELLRQIRRLELEISRFSVANCPYAAVPASRQRGPAILTTAQLEEIRDELLASRSALHELVVLRMSAGMQSPASSRPPWQRLRRNAG
ncbi:MAG: hypothetical protein JWN65_1479 [Solirubrobacterales bacterium]|nr:hypothetical protein [Solirubrobacterales bacterium]